MKAEHDETARQLFTDTDVNISIEGKRHLGAALGSRTFTEEYVTNKVQGWEAALVASSANQACVHPVNLFSTGGLEGLLPGHTCMAIANGSPCVVPSVEAISPLPTITILTGVL